MANDSKTQHQSISPLTTTSNAHYDISSNGGPKTMDTFLQDNSDSDHLTNVDSTFVGDEQYPTDIYQHERNTFELNPDGSIVLSPHHLLPNEILSLIFSHLVKDRSTIYHCTLVSKQFNIITTPLLWQKLNFYHDNNDIYNRCFTCLFNTLDERFAILGQHIRELDINGSHWSDTHLLRLLPHIHQLEHLRLYRKTNITETSFQFLPQHCQRIIRLHIHTSHLTQTSFSAIGQHCHQLRELRWVILTEQSSEWLQMLTTPAQSSSSSLENLSLVVFRRALNEDAIHAIKTMDRLTCLVILNTGPPRTIRTASTLLNNPDISSPIWPQLTILRLRPCDDLDDSTMIGFLKSHPHLQQLSIGPANQLTDITLDAIDGLLNLTHINISYMIHMTHDGVWRFLVRNHLPSLLSVKFGPYASDILQAFPESIGHNEFELDRQGIELVRLRDKQQQQQQQQQMQRTQQLLRQ